MYPLLLKKPRAKIRLSNARDSSTIGGVMKTRMVTALLVVCAALPGSLAAKRKEKEPPKPVAPIGWLDLHGGSRKFSVSEEDFQKVTRHLAQGMLVPVF